ncbi:LysR family transcriptional regulator [Paenibacillus sedimenti]|uniref:LysR family transcriptional regulator n=1 Tax=Paenibacillus sedimenti TaxID=2770274 RepID=A0A926KS09_9BACL|nr:LysR family transcriptional regulator [Paenibacillus sedimenti]MBD0383014.1 LysR family transcriptional regulator [Paenibacillus sedimenti]
MIIDTLTVFAAVCEQRNFSRAAELLHISQPGVSQHIRNLEDELAAKLLHRSPKQVKLTEAGEILYKRAKQILALYDEAKQEINLLQHTVSGSLKIGASFTIGEYMLPRLLAEYANQYPQVDAVVNIGNTLEIVQSVRDNDLDIGLVEGQVQDTELHITPFMKDELILIAPPSHPLSGERAVNPDRLQNQIWILRESGSGTRAFSDQFIHDAGLRIKRSYVFNSSQGVKESVAAGLGIAILSRSIVRKELESGELSEIPLKGNAFTRDFFMISKHNHSPTMAMNVFIQKVTNLRDVL